MITEFTYNKLNKPTLKLTPLTILSGRDDSIVKEVFEKIKWHATHPSIKDPSIDIKPKRRQVIYISSHGDFGENSTIISMLLVKKRPDIRIFYLPTASHDQRTQSQFGSKCVDSLNNGEQIILFTHSDHVLQGIRVCVREELILPSNVSIYYFEGNRVYAPKIYKDGGIDPWPDGFFDQSCKDLMKLF